MIDGDTNHHPEWMVSIRRVYGVESTSESMDDIARYLEVEECVVRQEVLNEEVHRLEHEEQLQERPKGDHEEGRPLTSDKGTDFLC